MKPFLVNITDDILVDLRGRLKKTRWPDEVVPSNWRYGTDKSFLQSLVEYWIDGFDWREQEAFLNSVPQFTATVGDYAIHFVYKKGTGVKPLPLVISHGWPSSFSEMYNIIGPLTEPERFGGAAADSFDVVIPSLPGFGFTPSLPKPGWIRVDVLWRELMTKVLNYDTFCAHGCDVGARVTSALGRFHGDVVRAIHIGSVDLDWPDPLPPEFELTAAERDYIQRVHKWEKDEGAYADIQGTYPQTVAYALNDSPAGLASWIVEKFRAWSDCHGDILSRFSMDELLTNITIYWATETINSSMRRYFEARHNQDPNPLPLGQRIGTPAGIAMFPGEKDLLVPREFAERCYNIRQWTTMPSGGHFPAIEEPELLVNDLRTFFRPFR